MKSDSSGRAFIAHAFSVGGRAEQYGANIMVSGIMQGGPMGRRPKSERAHQGSPAALIAAIAILAFGLMGLYRGFTSVGMKVTAPPIATPHPSTQPDNARQAVVLADNTAMTSSPAVGVSPAPVPPKVTPVKAARIVPAPRLDVVASNAAAPADPDVAGARSVERISSDAAAPSPYEQDAAAVNQDDSDASLR